MTSGITPKMKANEVIKMRFLLAPGKTCTVAGTPIYQSRGDKEEKRA
jgi:hypothetical protein